MVKPAPTGRIPCLDGLRALAIVLVLFEHTLHARFGKAAAWASLYGSLGVSIFFVLSGYLITLLLLREWHATDTLSLKAFYGRRTLRIFPAFYTYVLVMVILNHLDVLATPRSDLWAAALYVWNYHVNASSSWYLSHFWSLSLEEQFYLVWPLTLLLAGPRRAGYVAAALLVLVPLSRVLTYFLWPEARGHTGMMLHTALDRLMYGCLAALWQGSPRFQVHLQRLFRWRAPWAALVFLFAISPVLTYKLRGGYSLPLGMSLESLAITVLMLWLVQNPDRWLGQILNARAVVHVGVISYSLYIWQQLFLAEGNETWLGVFPLNLLCAWLAAECSYWLIERPFLSLKGYLAPHRERSSSRPVTVYPVEPVQPL